MFLASDVIKRHFGAHTESQEISLLPVAKHFLLLCLAKIHLKDTYCVMICHHCQKYGHMAEKCPEKMEAKLQPVENVLVVINHQAVVKQKRKASIV